MWTAKRREAEELHQSKTKDRLRRLMNLEANIMASDPVEVELRIRQMSYGHRVRP